MRPAVLGLLLVAACSRVPSADEPPVPWKAPQQPDWGPLPKTDADATALASKEAVTRPELRSFEASALASLPADATKLVAGLREIAAAYDVWMRADAKKPAYLVFGTMHDSRAELETAASIALRMKAPWGLALEQLRATSRWRGAPATPSADDDDLAILARGAALDEGALARVTHRQLLHDHAAWKYGYLDAMTSLVWQARGAGKPLLGCDLPTELRGSLTPGEPERDLREMHCARALRADALSLARAHAPEGGLSDDDPAPPERFAVVVGARHAEPDGLPRFLPADARVAVARVLGGRPRDASSEASELAPRLVVTDVVLVRLKGIDALLLPDDTWGGVVDRSTDPTPDRTPPGAAWLPPSNVLVTSDVPARFAVTDSSIDVGPKPEWLSARAGHHAYVLVSEALTSRTTFVGAVDVPETGWVELAFAPGARGLRIVLHPR
jgi:hypothetical protein